MLEAASRIATLERNLALVDKALSNTMASALALESQLAERTRELGAAQFDIRKERGIAEGYAMRTRQAESAILSALRQGQQDARDAARYRWIRDCWYIAGEEWPEELQHEPTRPAQFDAAIDAAIAAEREGKS